MSFSDKQISMMRGNETCPTVFPMIVSLRRRFRGMRIVVMLLALAAITVPLMAFAADATPASSNGASGEDFGQYLADHQDDLAPFFLKNAGDLFKLAVPLAMGMSGWIVLFTMLVGWGIDVLMSRGYAFFFAPVFADWKRSIVYATGRLCLSLIYTCLIGLAIVLCLGLAHAGVIILSAVLVLMVVAFAAQIVWVLYLFHSSFSSSAMFYLAIIVVHSIAGIMLAVPLFGSRAPQAATQFIDSAITPRLRDEVAAMRRQLASVKADRDAALVKTADLQNQISQAATEQDRLHQQIEEKKNSDIYVLAQIIKVRANGDLASARDQLGAFPAKFPGSPLNSLVRAQLDDVNNQIAMASMQEKQQEADAAKAAAQARADLLDRVAKGEVTLSEMRHALIAKTRAQVKELLGPPSDTGPDSWSYSEQMIINPMTNEKHGLFINFSEGIVQGVDYSNNGGGATQ